MGLYNVYLKEKTALCVEIEAEDIDQAKRLAADGEGFIQWRDHIDYVDEESWTAERVDDENAEDDDELDDEIIVEPDEAEVAIRRVQELAALGELRQARIGRAVRAVRAEAAEPAGQEAEDVDFDG